MNELELFAGAGGGILGSMLLGHRTVCAVEYNAYARSVLLARQADGTFPHFPIWDDVRTFDGRPWRSIVDVVSGGFPCQDVSAAGGGDGLDGERSGLWSEMARVIREVRPRFVRVENSPMLTSRGLGRVLGDLAAMGFDAEWGVLSAADAGAPHLRERLWMVAELADASSEHAQVQLTECAHQERRPQQGERQAGPRHLCHPRWPSESGMDRIADGVAHRSHRLKAIGNGQVSRVAAAAWQILTEAT
ncbi:DNA cytosine methyltransferase [Variovorax sp. GB1P17]|uniref:DNA cytosine methyltransferase n=1 Tax=Variovorax sp. GB1P17 TaxID=3443740 RepID=UPI003F456BED